MIRKLLTLLIVGIAAAAAMSYGCGGGEQGAYVFGRPYTAYVSGTVFKPVLGPNVNRDTWEEGDADGDAQGDNIYESVALACAFGVPSVEGGAVVDVSEDDASSCSSPNNCLVYTVSTGAAPLCSVTIDATFSVGLPDIAISWIEIPLQTTMTMKTSLESTDGKVVLGYSSADWSDAYDFTDIDSEVTVDLSACAAGTGILELAEDGSWAENDDTATRYVQGYDFVSIDPQTVGPDYYAECVATADTVGKVALTDIATTPVSSTGTVHFATLLCDDNWDNDCLIDSLWAY